MILQALNRYYNRLSDDPETDIPPIGFSQSKMSFALVLSRDGDLIDVRDIRDQSGKKPRPQLLQAPEAVKRTVAISPNFMWDNTTYVLGADDKDKPERARQAFDSFCEYHQSLLAELDSPGVKALLGFLEQWEPEKAEALRYWEDMAGTNLVFQLEGELRYLHQDPAVRKLWERLNATPEDEPTAMCLVTGEETPIARLHPAIKGVRDAQSSGASIVSFNLAAFCSYDKKQNYNAPIGNEAAFAYTTVLNHLLRQGSNQRLQIGDATTVFWTERTSPLENMFGQIMDPGKQDEEDQQPVRQFLDAVRQGKWREADLEPECPFYILGLAPNASRLSIRFWYASTVQDISQKLLLHFDQLGLKRSFANESAHPGLWLLLTQTAVQGKLDNVPPLLAGAIMQAILTGQAYPRSWLTAVIGRIRSDQTVNYLRAASIKACLVRNHNLEVTMALDSENRDVAYLLGRLFAILEKTQHDALGKTNRTIRDSYISSASATPKAVFPNLLRLAQAHIKKADNGGYDAHLIEGVMQHINGFPGHLSIEQQGQFFIGYYHQRQALYTKKEDAAATPKA